MANLLKLIAFMQFITMVRTLGHAEHIQFSKLYCFWTLRHDSDGSMWVSLPGGTLLMWTEWYDQWKITMHGDSADTIGVMLAAHPVVVENKGQMFPF